MRNGSSPRNQPASHPLLWVPLACLWLLTLVTFSMPGRDGPSDAGSLDVIALAKLATRGIVIMALGITLLACGSSPRRRLVLWCLAPFGIYLLWAIASVAWSPLKAISLGQAGSLTAELLLAAVVAVLWRSEADTSRLLCHLCCSLLAVTLVVLAAHIVSADLSGLTRGGEMEGSMGIVHPTSAGATAALGLLLLAGSRLLWGWRWPTWLLLPGLPLFSVLLVLAASRMAMFMGLVVLAVMVAWLVSRFLLASTVLVVSVGGTLFLVADPRLESLDGVFRKAEEYVSRGESTDSMSSLTGRTELWDALWDSFLESPWRGHGYFVTSKDGLLDVWSGPANRSAHNVALQVMVTTGLIGLGLFLVAWLWLLPPVCRGLGKDADSRKLGVLLLLLAAFYLGWGQLCESFMGPIQPEAVVFFVLLGLALANARFWPVRVCP
jgi:O-antigen ligase